MTTHTTTAEAATQRGQGPQTQPTSRASTPEPKPTKNHISGLFNQHLKQTLAGGDDDDRDPLGGGGPGLLGWAQPGALVPVQPADDVKAIGKLLEPFYGDRTKAEHFMQEVKAYLRLNQDVSGFNSPMKKVAFVFTHMKGPNVAGWARDVGEVLDDLRMPQDNIPILWTQFCDEFEQQYMDSSRAEQARDELKKLEMKNDDIDAYVAKFEELARNASYNTGHAATVHIFMEGLNKKTLKDVLSPPRVTSYATIKDRAIQSVAAQKTIKHVLNMKSSRGSVQQTNPFNQTYHRPQPFYQHN
jgi:Retrotransposon gag protein